MLFILGFINLSYMVTLHYNASISLCPVQINAQKSLFKIPDKFKIFESAMLDPLKYPVESWEGSVAQLPGPQAQGLCIGRSGTRSENVHVLQAPRCH